MANTPRYGFPFPEYQHVPDVPKWNGDLATRVEQVVQQIGRIAQSGRESDDYGNGWGNFCGAALDCPAGAMLCMGTAVWGGKDAYLEIQGNGVVVRQVLTNHYQLGRYVDTLMGVFWHGGGVATTALNGSPAGGESLGYMGGSMSTLIYLGAGG